MKAPDKVNHTKPQIVRRMKSDMTHYAVVPATEERTFAGATYLAPDPGVQALCGVFILDGVVMRPETKVRCSACKHIERTVYR